MKPITRTFHTILFLIPVFVSQVTGQPPDWENKAQLEVQDYVTCATSNGHGQHVLNPGGAFFRHYLVRNNGTTLFGPTNVSPPRTSDFSASLASYNGTVYIVAEDNNQIKLYYSANGGQNWTSVTPHIPQGSPTIRWMDAYADNRGVHIVWDTDDAIEFRKVYYVLYNTESQQWQLQKDIRENTAGPIYVPKVTASSNKAIVSYVRYRAGSLDDIAGTLDYDFDLNEWDDLPREVSLSDEAENQSIAIAGNEVHMVMKTDDNQMWTSKRDLDGNWGSAQMLFENGGGNQELDFRRNLTSVGGKLYAIYVRSSGSPGTKLATYDPATGWSTTDVDADGTSDKTTISSSIHGVYLFWDVGSTNPWVRRKPLAITGHIAENSFFTGNNWVQGTANVNSTQILGNIGVEALSGSVTTVLPNTWWNIHGTLRTKAAGGGYPAAAVTSQSNAKIAARSGGTLNAEDGSVFKFWNWRQRRSSRNPHCTGNISFRTSSHVHPQRHIGDMEWNHCFRKRYHELRKHLAL